MSRVPKSIPAWLGMFFHYIGSKENEFDVYTTMNLLSMHWPGFHEFSASTLIEEPKSSKKKKSKKKNEKKRKKDDIEDGAFSEYCADSLSDEDVNDYNENDVIESYTSNYQDNNISLTSAQHEDGNGGHEENMADDIVDESEYHKRLEVFLLKDDWEEIEEVKKHVADLKEFISECGEKLEKDDLISINEYLFLLIDKLVAKS